jgi:2-polyprenyl-3-methyl-5-hydroxy-6-metoxy-1,4-benzoquinol methylase
MAKKISGKKLARLHRTDPSKFNRVMSKWKAANYAKGKLEVKKPNQPSTFIKPKVNAQQANFQPKRTFRFNPNAAAKKIADRAVDRANKTGKVNPLVTKKVLKIGATGGTVVKFHANPGAVSEAVKATQKKVAKGKAKLIKTHEKIIQNRQKQASQQQQKSQQDAARSGMMGVAKLGAAAYAARRVAGAITSIPGMLRRGGTYRF